MREIVNVVLKWVLILKNVYNMFIESSGMSKFYKANCLPFFPDGFLGADKF
jgi:hypothetical protein